MTREPAEPLRLDYLIKARTIYSMTGKTYRSVGLLGAEIAAVSAEPDGLDDLAGHSTAVVDASDLTLLPAFADSHEHLMEASRNTLLIRLARPDLWRSSPVWSPMRPGTPRPGRGS